MNSIKKKCFVICFVFLMATSFFVLNRGLIAVDDLVYGTAFSDFSTYIEWVKVFYNEWSGRIPVTSLISLFVNFPKDVFKISNTIVFLMVIFLIYKIVNILFEEEKNTYIKIVNIISIPCFVYFINWITINRGCLWLAGSLNYFWPLCCLLISIIPFICQLKSKEIKKINYVYFFLANIISATVEQTGLVLACFGLISIIISILNEKKISKLLIVHYVMILILTTSVFAAPGNMNREFAEEVLWYDEFGMLSTFEKIFIGFSNFVNHITKENIILFSYLIIQIIYLKNEKEDKKWTDYLESILLAIYWLTSIIMCNFQENYFTQININQLYQFKNILKLSIHFMVFGYIGIELIYLIKDISNGLIISILYFASIASGTVLGFSPTVFASGNRIFVLTDFFIVIINSCLGINVLKNMKTKSFVVYMFITVTLAICTYFYLCFDVYFNPTAISIY